MSVSRCFAKFPEIQLGRTCFLISLLTLTLTFFITLRLSQFLFQNIFWLFSERGGLFLQASQMSRKHTFRDRLQISLRVLAEFKQIAHFFKSNIFISNARLKLAKDKAKAKHHLEAEFLLFENYSLSSSTFLCKNNRWYYKNAQKTSTLF